MSLFTGLLIYFVCRNISPENSAKPEWVGDLNASYSLGPNPLNPGWKVKMNISTSNKRSVIYDTIGILRGSVEDGTHLHMTCCMKYFLKI